MFEWQKIKDEIGFIHTLKASDVAYVKVEKTRGGDYSITAMRNDDAAGGEVEYRNTLNAARDFAERIITDGSWIEYLP